MPPIAGHNAPLQPLLEELRLQNFRCFEDHTVPLRSTSVIVGENNSGKSTIIDALHLISIISQRYRSLAFRDPPNWSDQPKRFKGVRPSLKDTGLSFGETVFHRYQGPPATITARFATGHALTIEIGREAEVFAVVADQHGPITSKGEAYDVNLPTVSILPEVGPLRREEKIIERDRVRMLLSSVLAPSHFRNQLNLLSGNYQSFKQLVESTWPEVRLNEFRGRGKPLGTVLELEIRNRDFAAEVADMGNGLQIWLQIMWFLARTENASIVVLDEPDVYLHPNLQRRLIRLLVRRYPQTVLATHSTEILAEVDPEDVMVVNYRRPASRFTATQPQVQQVVERLGSGLNIQLARLHSSKRFLLTEGDEIKLLKHCYDRLFPEAQDSLGTVPSMQIKGWGGWSRAMAWATVLRDAIDPEIMVYCILDSDQHLEEEIKKRKKEAEENHIALTIWTRKEVENYLLRAEAIHRLIVSRKPRRTSSVQEISDQIDAITYDLREAVIEDLADNLGLVQTSLTPTGALREARRRVDQYWNIPIKRLERSPGKDVLRKLNSWVQAELGVSFGAVALARELRANEIHPEIVAVLRAIKDGPPLP